MTFKWTATFAACALAAAAPAAAKVERPLFESSEPIHIVIQAALPRLIGDRQHQGTIPGTLTEPNGQTLAVNLGLRGITRRSSDTCDFPPIRVNFENPPATSLFAGQKKLKLVTHCKNSPAFQQYVLLEYAAYKMYNLLTPRSFRVRLANIDYRDSNGRPIISRIGYFLEDTGEVAHRNRMKSVHSTTSIPLQDLSPSDAARYALFEHMIANHDWSMRAGPAGSDCCHNAKLIGVLAPGQTVPLPYDFDYSGYVGAPYATPPAELQISDVHERYYRGYCVHKDEAAAQAKEMLGQQAQIIGVLSQVPGLEPRTRQRAEAFLESFFNEIGSPGNFTSRILDHCVRG